MPIFECKNCGKVFNHKSHYDYHVNKRKRPCNKISAQSTPQKAQNNTQNFENVKKFKCPNCNKLYSRKFTLTRHMDKYCKLSNEVTNNENNNKTTQCSYCNKIFSRSDSLKRHLNICKTLLKFEKQKEDIFLALVEKIEKQNDRLMILENENQKLKQKINNTGSVINNINSNNTINNNTQNIINIVAFGEEDLCKLYDKKVKYFLRKGFQSVPALIKDTHFDKNKPEFHNVYISNLKDLYAMTYDGRKWTINYRDDVINQLFDDKQCYLINKFKELNNSLDNTTTKKFKRFLNEDDKLIIKGIKDDIKLMLYNNRDIPKETRKQMEKIKN